MILTDDFHNSVGFYKEKHGNTAVLTPEQVNIFIEIVKLLECGHSSDCSMERLFIFNHALSTH